MNKIANIFLLISTLTLSAHGQANNIKSLMNAYDVTYYHIDVEVNNKSAFVKGNTLIKAIVTTDKLKNFTIELSSNLKVDSVIFNQEKQKYTRENDFITCQNIPAVKKGNYFHARVFYQGHVKQGGFFTGFSSGIDPETGISASWSLSEPYGAKEWFACKQVLTDKADSVSVFITVPEGLKAGSNGLLYRTVNLPKGKTRYEWKTRYPIAYYLISIAVGEYQEYSFYTHLNKSQDSIFIQNYIYDDQEYFQKNKRQIDATGDLIKFFSEIYTPYPFMKEKYGHCVAPMPGGGMEHQTMTTIRSFHFTLIAHELAHSWFGNLVTCESFQDIWINEGFASYSEYLVLENMKTKNQAHLWMLSAQNRALMKPFGSVYVPAKDLNDIWRIFNTDLSYKKGACLLHMIRFELNNDELFFKVLKNFINAFAEKNATGEDFKHVLEKTSGIDFNYFFEQWYYGEGYPVFDINWKQENDTVHIFSNQTTSSYRTPFFKTSMEIKLETAQADTIIRYQQTSNKETINIYFPAKVTNIIIDPEKWLLKKVKGK